MDVDDDGDQNDAGDEDMDDGDVEEENPDEDGEEEDEEDEEDEDGDDDEEGEEEDQDMEDGSRLIGDAAAPEQAYAMGYEEEVETANARSPDDAEEPSGKRAHREGTEAASGPLVESEPAAADAAQDESLKTQAEDVALALEAAQTLTALAPATAAPMGAAAPSGASTALAPATAAPMGAAAPSEPSTARVPATAAPMSVAVPSQAPATAAAPAEDGTTETGGNATASALADDTTSSSRAEVEPVTEDTAVEEAARSNTATVEESVVAPNVQPQQEHGAEPVKDVGHLADGTNPVASVTLPDSTTAALPNANGMPPATPGASSASMSSGCGSAMETAAGAQEQPSDHQSVSGVVAESGVQLPAPGQATAPVSSMTEAPPADVTGEMAETAALPSAASEELSAAQGDVAPASMAEAAAAEALQGGATVSQTAIVEQPSAGQGGASPVAQTEPSDTAALPDTANPAWAASERNTGEEQTPEPMDMSP
jgi:hypothetical protein